MRTCYGCQTTVPESDKRCLMCRTQLRCTGCNELITSVEQQATHAACFVQRPEPATAPTPVGRVNQPTLGKVARDLGVIIAQPFARLRATRPSSASRDANLWRLVGGPFAILLFLSLILVLGRCTNPARTFYGTWEIVNAESGAESTLRIIIQPDHTATMTSLMVFRGTELSNESTSGFWWVDPKYPKSLLMNETRDEMKGAVQLTLPDRDRLRLAPADPEASTDDMSVLIYRRAPKN